MDHRRCFQFIWRIKDFNFTFNRSWSFESPIFFVEALGRTKWNLVLYNEYYATSEEIICRLQRQNNDFGPDHIELNYELSFVSADGTVIHSRLFLIKTYNKGNSHYMTAIDAYKAKNIMNKNKSFISDTLTIHCRMWPSMGRISKPSRCTTESRINTECKSIIGTIQQFCRLKLNTRDVVCFNSSPKEIISFMYLCLCVDDYGKLIFQIKPVDPVVKTYKLKVFILDIFKSKLKVSQGEIYNAQSLCIPLNVSMEYLMDNKEHYLPRDVLTIQCEFFFPAGNKLEIIHGNLFEYDVTNINPSSEQRHIKSKTTKHEDGLLSMFNEGILCDTKLKTATETFRAHKVVLGAQSPVFMSMFTTDMGEKTDYCVEIEDLDADTVHQMLIFLYSDILDLKHDSARSLYFAADKYNIISLKHKCSNFLKQNLLHSNCCDVLLLADKHQDKDLKGYTQNYIAENGEAVFSSDEWEKLEDTHPFLAKEVFRSYNRRTEVFNAIYKKNWRSENHIH